MLDEAALEGRGKEPGSADAASSTGIGARLFAWVKVFLLCCAFAAAGTCGPYTWMFYCYTLGRAFQTRAALDLRVSLALQLSSGWASAWQRDRGQLLASSSLPSEVLACAMWPFVLPGCMTMVGVEQPFPLFACPHSCCWHVLLAFSAARCGEMGEKRSLFGRLAP